MPSKSYKNLLISGPDSGPISEPKKLPFSAFERLGFDGNPRAIPEQARSKLRPSLKQAQTGAKASPTPHEKCVILEKEVGEGN